MLTVNLNAACDLFTLTTDQGYIENLNSPDPTDCCTQLVLGRNCCSNSEQTLYLRHQYPFVLEISNCQLIDVNGVDYHEITLTINGIDETCVSSITYFDGPNSKMTVENPNSTEVSFRYNLAEVTPSFIFQHSITIRTCNDNLEYTLNYSFDPQGFGDPCEYVFSPGGVIYPELPIGVTINGNTLELDSSIFGESETTFGDGVYYFSLSQNGIPLTEAMFVDCAVLCRVISFLSDYPCSDVYLFYEALKQSNSCDTVTYQQMCDLWTYLGKKLNYFTEDPCSEASPCGCQQQGTIILN